MVSANSIFRFDPSVVHVNRLEGISVENTLFSVECKVYPEPSFSVFSLELEVELLDRLVFFRVSVREVRVGSESKLLVGGVFNQ